MQSKSLVNSKYLSPANVMINLFIVQDIFIVVRYALKSK